MFKKLIVPAAILASTIIGAGFFSLPYIFQESGFLICVPYLFIFAGILFLLHLMYADIIMRTQKKYHFSGYARHYLGRTGLLTSLVAVLCGMMLTLTVYLVISKDFLKLFLPDVPPDLLLLIFWAISTLAIFWKVKKLAKAESLALAGIIAVIFIIFLMGTGSARLSFDVPARLSLWLLPYGAILFSLGGRSAIPALLGYFKKENLPTKKIRPVVFLGTFMPAVLYLVFVIGVIGLVGHISGNSILEIIKTLPSPIAMLFGTLGLISLWSSYIVIGRDAEKSLEKDFFAPDLLAVLAIAAIPLVLFFSGFNDFLKLVGIIGGVFSGTEGILVIMMWIKASRRSETGEAIKIKIPESLAFFLAAIFLAGALYFIFY